MDLTKWQMSRLFAYYFSRKYHSDIIQDTGTYIKTVLHAIRKYGLPPEKYWPYLLDAINEQPSFDALIESDNLRGISYYEIPENNKTWGTRRCLADKKPVIFGAYINQEFMLTDGLEILDPAKDGEPTGGHAMYCNGWGYNENNETYFDVVSSWGTQFGNLGTCRVSPAFINKCQDLSIIDNI
jgi:C1A family cysteine protease